MPDHVRNNLDAPDGAFAMLSTDEPVTTAVIFVHGFGGDAEGTWFQFQTLVDRHDPKAWWRAADLFFYTYESVAKPVRLNAARFAAFLDGVFPHPDAKLFEVDVSPLLQALGLTERIALREKFDRYQTLVFVAHSEGALVIRTLLLDRAIAADELVRREEASAVAQAREARESNPAAAGAAHERQSLEDLRRQAYEKVVAQNASSLLLDAGLCLFAPAHAGCSITGPLAALLELPGFGALLRPLLAWSTAKSDLAPASPLITGLRSRSDTLAQSYPWIRALRAKILWGEDEKVVHVDKFSYDTEKFLPRHDHLSICKPNHDFLDPLEFVEDHAGQH
jgi:hypothetical protein